MTTDELIEQRTPQSTVAGRPFRANLQTALALVSAEVGCHLTLASVAENVTDPHVVFIPLNESTPSLDVHLRAAWRRADQNPALRAVLDELLTLNDGAAG